MLPDDVQGELADKREVLWAVIGAASGGMGLSVILCARPVSFIRP